MNFTNKYIFLYSSGLVIIVAALLSFTAVQLKPTQDANILIEKKQNILSSVNIASTTENADAMFSKYITGQQVVDGEGKEVSGTEAFNVNLAVETRKKPQDRHLPIYECTLDDGLKAYILPVRGKGLWGPIWGYVALKEDLNTIVGVTFDHKSETPGLGAEINTLWFQKPFIGKTIFDESQGFVSITVHKGGAAAAGDTQHGVDAISGGTITSKALEEMLKDCLGSYQPYIKNKGTIQ